MAGPLGAATKACVGWVSEAKWLETARLRLFTNAVPAEASHWKRISCHPLGSPVKPKLTVRARFTLPRAKTWSAGCAGESSASARSARLPPPVIQDSAPRLASMMLLPVEYTHACMSGTSAQVLWACEA